MPITTYEQEVLENKKRRQEMHVSRKEAKSTSAEVSKILESYKLGDVSLLKDQAEKIAKTISKVQYQLELMAGSADYTFRQITKEGGNTGGTTLVSRLRIKRNKLQAKFRNLLSVHNDLVDGFISSDESHDLTRALVEEAISLQSYAEETFVEDADYEDEISDAIPISVTHGAAETTAISSDFKPKKLTEEDIYDSIQEAQTEEPVSTTYWKIMEEFWFRECDLINTIYFYRHRIDTFWPEWEHRIGLSKDSNGCYDIHGMSKFQKGCLVIMRQKRDRDFLFMKDAESLLDWLQTRPDYPRDSLLEVKNGFQGRIHEDFNKFT